RHIIEYVYEVLEKLLLMNKVLVQKETLPIYYSGYLTPPTSTSNMSIMSSRSDISLNDSLSTRFDPNTEVVDTNVKVHSCQISVKFVKTCVKVVKNKLSTHK
ncbi:5822_t:CDS:2, partial [Funneliformis mosseae]